MIQDTISPVEKHVGQRRISRVVDAGNDRIDSILLRLDAIRNQRGLTSFVVGIAACDRNAGVSTVTGRLAVRAAEMKFGRVLLIDGNFAHPRQHKNFRIKNDTGLMDAIFDEAALQDAVQPTEIKHLFILPAGNTHPSQAVSPDSMATLMREIRLDFQYVFVDLPPVRNAARSLVLSGQTDGIVLIADAQSTGASHAQRALQLLADADIGVIGTVVNRTVRTLPRWLDRWL